MPKSILLMILLLFTYSVVNGFNDYETRRAEIQEADSAPGFHKLGYLRDNDGNKIPAIKIPGSATRDQVERYAKGRTSEAGRFAMIYFFEYGPEISNHEKNRAESLLVANDLVYDKEELGEWRFSFLRKLDGATRMVDCDKFPESDLCRT